MHRKKGLMLWTSRGGVEFFPLSQGYHSGSTKLRQKNKFESKSFVLQVPV